MIDKKIGKKIKQIRNICGLSQSELAEKVGVSFQQIQKYEKGSTRISVIRLHQISEALGVNVAFFFKEEEKIPKVSDTTFKYSPNKKGTETFPVLDKEEITLLKLFRKTKNKKIKEGILRQLRAVIELENRKKDST